MGSKKVCTVGDCAAEFISVLSRAALDSYSYVNRTMISKSPKGYQVLVIPDLGLWNHLMEDKEFKAKLSELQPTDPSFQNIQNLLTCAEKINEDGWISPVAEDFFGGKVIKVEFPGFLYALSFTKDALPLKLRKAEQNNVAYRVFTKPENMLVIKKRFVFKDMEQYGWTIIRAFLVL